MEFNLNNRVKQPKLLNLFPENPCNLKYEIHTPQTSTPFRPSRAGAPVGSYELDLTLSLPVEVRVESTANKKDPELWFHQFDDERSYEKFQAGQIWAFYGGDDDEVPRYYGKIKEVRRIGSRIVLQVIYLTFFWLSNKVVRWDDEDMIISCGKFKAKGKLCTYHNTYCVSHQVDAKIVGNNKDYEIYPRLGEIWALYRGWTSKLKRSDLKNCEYDIVEVIEEGYSWTYFLYLEKVSGYNSVFKRKLTGGGGKKTYISIDGTKIDRTEVLRFSHQIPAFKLTEKHDSNLKGFWELDPGAIPVRYLR